MYSRVVFVFYLDSLVLDSHISLSQLDCALSITTSQLITFFLSFFFFRGGEIGGGAGGASAPPPPPPPHFGNKGG